MRHSPLQWIKIAAKSAFRKTADGNLVFYRGGPFSRPYLVPDEAIERRLLVKRTWMMGLLFAFLFAQPLIGFLVPKLFTQNSWCLLYLACIAFSFWAVGFVLLRRELANLKQLDARIPLDEYLTTIARSSSTAGLILGMVIVAGLVFVGVWILATGRIVSLAILFLLLGVPSLGGFGYASWAKWRLTND